MSKKMIKVSCIEIVRDLIKSNYDYASDMYNSTKQKENPDYYYYGCKCAYGYVVRMIDEYLLSDYFDNIDSDKLLELLLKDNIDSEMEQDKAQSEDREEPEQDEAQSEDREEPEQDEAQSEDREEPEQDEAQSEDREEPEQDEAQSEDREEPEQDEAQSEDREEPEQDEAQSEDREEPEQDEAQSEDTEEPKQEVDHTDNMYVHLLFADMKEMTIPFNSADGICINEVRQAYKYSLQQDTSINYPVINVFNLSNEIDNGLIKIFIDKYKREINYCFCADDDSFDDDELPF